MSARTARSTTPAPSLCKLTGFDAMNLAGAIEQLEAARGSLDAIRPAHGAQVAKQLERLGTRVAELIGELRALRGTP